MSELAMPAPELRGGQANLVLAGFSATGKTEAGSLAAQLLEMPFVDLDQIAERRMGRSIADAFSSLGEARFRELEVGLLEDAARLSGAVIATGGGAVLHPQFATLAAGAVTVVLTASAAELERRLRGDRSRPLLAGGPKQRITDLMADRAPAYAASGFAIETTAISVAQVADLIAEHYRLEFARNSVPVTVLGPAGPYPVVVGPDALQHLEPLLAPMLKQGARVVIASDEAVLASAGARVSQLLQGSGRRVASVAVGRGEASKRLAAVSDLWDRFQMMRVDRGDLVIAVGGGALLDAVGFACATWARGVPWVTVPTTVLAMVDASIGGKVAIDRGAAKNAVGAFHHPRAVVCAPELLATLPAGAARDGLAEVVKVACLASPLLLDSLEQSQPLGDGLPSHLSWMIEQAVRIKAAYVAADPQDHALRQSLNLGHTYAHGLEAASDYQVSHGRAVAVGLLAASRLGVSLGHTPTDLPDRLHAALGKLGLLEPLPPIDGDRVRAAVTLDKKSRGGAPAFVVPTAGGALLVSGIDLEPALQPLWEVLAGQPVLQVGDPTARVRDQVAPKEVVR
ncbi:MAG: bifunctional shikimate kinase/3-dehydroquinate synthase [Candidatus Dormiibacterota bacterium]|jgi:shikimate kinase/3-dehydroquinate synthase